MAIAPSRAVIWLVGTNSEVLTQLPLQCDYLHCLSIHARQLERAGLLCVKRCSIFFHEYGRYVGMMPRSSLKEGKYNQMVEKRTKTTQQQTKQNEPQPTGRDSTTK